MLAFDSSSAGEQVDLWAGGGCSAPGLGRWVPQQARALLCNSQAFSLGPQDPHNKLGLATFVSSPSVVRGCRRQDAGVAGHQPSWKTVSSRCRP